MSLIYPLLIGRHVKGLQGGAPAPGDWVVWAGRMRASAWSFGAHAGKHFWGIHSISADITGIFCFQT